MLPTKKFNQLPIVTEVNGSTLVFCIVNGSDSLVSLNTLQNYFGVISGSGSENLTGILYIADSYNELLSLGEGSEFYLEPYLYKKVGTGILKLNPDTEFSTPLSTGVNGGIVVSTFAEMLLAENGFEYHESPYIYKKCVSGVCRLQGDTDFIEPSGTGISTGIVFSSYLDLLSSSFYGYEYHESPYIYKRTISGVLKIMGDTDFSTP